jgi:ribosomal protein S27AE
MGSQETELAARLTAFGHEPSAVTATVSVQSPGARVARVLAGLAMFWGVALVCVFIPVAHFILVPVFLLTGIVVAIMRAREDRRLILLRGSCPRCGAAQEFRPGGRFVDGRRLDCPRCHGDVTLAVASP